MKKKSELWGLLTLGAATILLLSVIGKGWLGLVGHGIGTAALYSFGLGSYLIIAYTILWGVRLLLAKTPAHPRREIIAFGVLVLSFCTLLTVAADYFPALGAIFDRFVYTKHVTHVAPAAYREIRYYLGGAPLYALYIDLPLLNLKRLLSEVGTTLIFTATAGGAILVMTETELVPALAKLLKRKEKKAAPIPVMSQPAPAPRLPTRKPKKVTPLPAPTPRPRSTRSVSGYVLPGGSQLSEMKGVNLDTLKKDLQRQAEVLEETLLNFGIEGKVVAINCGPTITSFEVNPPTGVKVQRIKALESDIALNMQAKSIRIIAPIPGKAAVGIEVPNLHPQPVNFKDLLADYRKGKELEIPLLLGKSVNGETVIYDLVKMPHLIIAGATGSGKSVCINAIIMSILMNNRPDEVRLLMIDPKKVELTGYSELPHMIAPVITEPHEACIALNWLVKEMERRYELLKQVGVRNIVSFNSRKRDIRLEESLDVEVPEKMSYIVGIVDELADLMMASSSDIETPITRIAQMARAVGIHLILATQRPSREVITGLIKANFPARIAFKVANRINSQIILDDTGAESLLGMGDMLVLPPGTAHPVRAQGVYVGDADINKVVSDITRQAPTNYLIQSFTPSALGASDAGERDALYSEALLIVKAAGVASTTFLQRKLKIGYARAASIVDELEERGIIGPQEGSKPRRVLVK